MVLIISDRTARELEENTNRVLATIYGKLGELKPSDEKLHALVHRSVSSQKFSKRNSAVLNKPAFEIGVLSIKASDSLKILGIIVDNKLACTIHMLTLYTKAFLLTTNFNPVLKTNWSLDRNIIKIYYNTVIRKVLLYGEFGTMP
ncbi:hypothetical protein AVEN_53711-1 [Araneus ventricosus]|uniref:Uncharacterized protein n=1 Tax=Araneus ventricosus TaxID=182803 RepID=A0A4Y2D386_ARAVE|nr:hypothetical protein AVEN_53711-1 [Araneus ventricosus]